MEFLRQYLVGRKASLDVRTLLLFGSQVASALEYLHGQQFVHRDVAARNVLVFGPQLVKLSDFGLSRALDYDAVYTASRGKLPIKWMAPESINFREFSMASDVWMFGVCCWEIMSWGQKPWTTVSNADVIGEIEAGKRPPCPEACPPALYGYLEKHIWAQQPPKRPLMNEVSQILRDVLEQLKRRVHPEQIRVVRPIQNIPVIRTNIECLPNLTLWRTLEEQRRQMEEDERWLQQLETQDGEGDGAQTAPLGDDDENLNRVLRSLALDEETPNGNIPPTHNVSASQLNCVRRAAESIAENVGKLENTYSQQMKHEDFVHGIKEITTRLREMFSEAAPLVVDCAVEKQHEMEKCEALIGNDMRQMSKAMQALAENLPSVAYNAHRRDVVRIARDLSSNCRDFVDLLTRRHHTVPSPAAAQLTDC
ncbi:unnamed protein product, partial [Mesorhabditis spiculigera]